MSLMKTVGLFFLALIVLGTVGWLQQQPATVSGQEQSHTLNNLRQYQVQYTHTIENTGDNVIPSQDIWIPVPASSLNQTVLSVVFNVQPTELLEDNWGQQIAHYVITNMAGGSSFDIGWTAEIQISDISFNIEPTISLDDVPEVIISTYTADDERFLITDPIIVSAAADAVAGKTTLKGKVEGIYQYVEDHLSYLMEGGWDDAPTVLSRGTGSCSEYSYVMMALLRANGIPCRMVGGTRNRSGAYDNYTDTVFHRAVEVYLPNYGWVPIDADLGDTKGQPIFTRYNDHFIFQMSGGRSSLLRWDYRSRLRVADTTEVTRSTRWAVSEVDLNLPPALDTVGNKFVNEGATLTFTVSASDPDGDTLTCLASNLPQGAIFNPATQTFSWTPGYDQAGVYPGVHFEVCDGSLTDYEDITITISNIHYSDFNNDGNVNVLDIIVIGKHWGETGSDGWITEDVNEDGTINVLDIILIGQYWTA